MAPDFWRWTSASLDSQNKCRGGLLLNHEPVISLTAVADPGQRGQMYAHCLSRATGKEHRSAEAAQRATARMLDASNNREAHRPCSSVSQLGISGRPASTHLLFSSFNDCAPVLHVAHRTC